MVTADNKNTGHANSCTSNLIDVEGSSRARLVHLPIMAAGYPVTGNGLGRHSAVAWVLLLCQAWLAAPASAALCGLDRTCESASDCGADLAGYAVTYKLDTFTKPLE